MKLKSFCMLVLAFVMIVSLTIPAYAAPVIDGTNDDGSEFVQKEDNKPDSLTTKQLELKKHALEEKLNGKKMGKTHEVAKGQFVELEREGEGAIWTVLGEFADLSHNTIPEPDRTVDNSTIWEPDFSRDYYMNLLFSEEPGANSMRNYYIEQSSGRYAVNGDVTDWIQVPGNAADYDDNEDNDVWKFLNDTINIWYEQQIAAGKTPDQINEYLSQFDVKDRYDYDGDGDFDEPDGYIDTIQFVHAGEGEEAGAPAWTIWSHSWYVYSNMMGITGPDFNKLGGIQIGGSSFWVGKYTIQPENGGVGVFTHEYAHDMGLPDLYDTSGGENGTGFWTLMSSGSWMGDGTVDIGSKSSHMGAWEKFQMGWLEYDVARAGEKSTHRLGPMEFNTKQAQAVFVVLPKKSVSTYIGDPYEGDNFYYSGSGDDLDNIMYKSFDLAEGATLTAKVNYAIEEGYDYAYLVYSTDNGATWQRIETNLSVSEEYGFGITGFSDGWVDLTADLPAGNVLLGFRYYTDGGVAENGFMIDNIEITGYEIDGAEADAGWTFDPDSGFRTTNGTEEKLYSHYYIAEYRAYDGYDSTLKTGPYFFGYLDNPDMANYVDHFPYQDGLLINYWDTSQINNQTRRHPGEGMVLPIDAHYTALRNVNGSVWRNRIQTYDSTFTLFPTDAISNIHVNSVLSPIESLPAVSVFDDSIQYYDPDNPQGSVMNPNTGTTIVIRSQNEEGMPPFMEIQVRPKR